MFQGNSYLFPAYDPDALAMFDARAALGDDPGEAYKQAISDYVTALKAVSGLWSNIIQLVVLAGATTVASAGRSIKGPNLTGVNLVNADIALKTGAKGNGTTKYFQTGYTGAISGTGQDNFHTYQYLTEESTLTTRSVHGRGTIAVGNGAWIVNSPGASRANNETADTGGVGGTGGFGQSRASSTAYTRMNNGSASTITRNSQAPSIASMFILARGNVNTPENFSDARFLVWALGPAVTLTDYNTPTDNLVTALNAI